MFIKVSDLKAEVDQFHRILKDYEESHLRYYNELYFSSNYWNDGHSKLFYRDIEQDKQKVLNHIDDLFSLHSVYRSLIGNYQALGDKITWNLDMKDVITLKFDNYIQEINNVISMYGQVDVSFCSDLAGTITSEKRRLEEVRKKVEQVRAKTKETFEKIESIEEKTKLSLSKIKLEIWKEKDTSIYF